MEQLTQIILGVLAIFGVVEGIIVFFLVRFVKQVDNNSLSISRLGDENKDRKGEINLVKKDIDQVKSANNYEMQIQETTMKNLSHKVDELKHDFREFKSDHEQGLNDLSKLLRELERERIAEMKQFYHEISELQNK